MAKKDNRIDQYIAKSPEYAKPILMHLRDLVHKACPDVEETIKWGMPSFDYKGPYFSMAAFKQHAVYGFWKAALMKDPALMDNAKNETAMGHGGKITSIKELPSDKKLLAYFKEAKKLNDDDVKLPPRKKTVKKDIVVPEYMMKAIRKNKKALAAFDAFSPSHKNEYIEWITEAKTDATREKRIATMMEWLVEGKSRNWKYVRK